MGTNNRLAVIEDFKSIRDNIAFHFSSKSNLESILNEGLRPKIGDNASGGLGQSAIEKTYISYGLEGVLQLYNRLISLSFDQQIGDLNTITHKPFVPDSAKEKDPHDTLSMIEGFEMVRQYMEDNVYFVFDATTTQYEHSVCDEDIEAVNLSIKELEDSGVNVGKRYKELNKRIRELTCQDAQGNKEEILRLVSERNRLSLLVREKTLPIINRQRGALLNESDNPIMEEVDYNDERLRWKNQIKEPHNTHTRIVDNNGRLQGVRITKDMIRVFSNDGRTPANGLEFLEAMLGQVNANDRIYLDIPTCHDCNLLYKFLEYVQMVKKYESDGLLVTKPEETFEIGGKRRTVPEHQVMDLTDIGKYPGLAEFVEGLEQYYEVNRYKRTARSYGEETLDKQKDTEAKKDVEHEMAIDERNLDDIEERK